MGRLREIVFGAQDGAISTTMVGLTLIGSGADPGTVVFAGIATAAAGIVSMSAGAWQGSKAERDVREAYIADKRRQVVEQPLVEHTKLARILEQEGSEPSTAWQQASRYGFGCPLPSHAGEAVRHLRNCAGRQPLAGYR